MKFAEITITITGPDNLTDAETECMIEAYDELDMCGVLSDAVDLHLASRTALCCLNVAIAES